MYVTIISATESCYWKKRDMMTGFTESIIKLSEYIKTNGKGSLASGCCVIILVYLISNLVYLISNPDKAFKWKSEIQRLFVGVSKAARKGTISNRIRSDIISSTRKVGLQELAPEDIKIEWVKNETPESFFEGNQIIVRMSNQNNPQKNLVKAVCTYVRNGTLKKPKRYLTDPAITACDYILTRKLLLQSSEVALDYYDEHIQPISQIRDKEVLLLIEELGYADRNGMFIPVFLNELKKLANSIYPDPLTDELTKTIKAFLSFLISVAKGTGYCNTQKSDLTYRKGFFRINLAFTASDETLLTHGEELYINKIKSAFEYGRCQTEYLFAIGTKIKIANAIAKKAQKELGFVRVTKRYYTHIFDTGIKKNAVCIEIDRIND